MGETTIPSVGGIPPSRAATFVPRDEALVEDLRQALLTGQQAGLVGLRGFGGIGKTELARHLAEEIEARWPDRVVWITAADRSLAEVHNALAAAAGFKHDPTWTPQQRYDALVSKYQGSGKVVVIDDVRRELAEQFDICCLPCAMLVTSRQQQLNGLPAGAMRDLELMTEDEAMALLRGVPDLASAVDREQDAAAELCRLCSYHPLALTLAAKRLRQRLQRATPIADLSARLDDRLNTLQTGSGPRESLRANFDLSYAELGQNDQRHFRQLSIFAATGFSLGGAAYLWENEESQTRETVQRLEDASLLGPGGTPGWWLPHDLLREHAAEKLSEAGKDEAVARKLADYLIQLFNTHYLDDLSSAPHVALEVDNLRLAADLIRASQKGIVLARLATSARNWLFNIFRLWEDWQGWLEASLTFGLDDPILEANTRQAIGDIHQFRKDLDGALQQYQQAFSLFQQVGDRLGEANTRQAIGDVHRFRDEYDDALQQYQQALSLFQQVGDRLGEANARKAIGDILQFRKDLDDALQQYQQALSLFQQVGDRLGEANALRELSRLALMAGEQEEAEEQFRQSIQLRQSTGDKYSEGLDHYGFAQTLLKIGPCGSRLGKRISWIM